MYVYKESSMCTCMDICANEDEHVSMRDNLEMYKE